MQKKINPLLQVKPINSYPENLIKSIKMISFDPNKGGVPFGSYIYRLQRYPGDVDLFEEYIEHTTPNKLVHHFADKLKDMIIRIRNEPYHWFSEFKAGIDPRYDVSIGDLKNGIWKNIPNIIEISKNFLKEGLFNEKEISKINDAIYNKKYTDADSYDIIYNIFRNRRILRWTENEILNGSKEVLGRVFKLHDCLFDHTYIKIDVIIYNDHKFVEITNFIGLVSEYDFPNKNYININLVENNDPRISLPKEIERLYFSDYYYSPFKCCKRIYSYARQLDLKRMLNKIIPIVTGDISALYMIKSQIDTMKLLLERIPIERLPLELFKESIDNIKNQLSYVLFISTKALEEDYEVMNKIIYGNYPINIIIKFMDYLSNKWFISINYVTIQEMKKHGINPPPKSILPKELTYKYFSREPISKPNIK